MLYQSYSIDELASRCTDVVRQAKAAVAQNQESLAIIAAQLNRSKESHAEALAD